MQKLSPVGLLMRKEVLLFSHIPGARQARVSIADAFDSAATAGLYADTLWSRSTHGWETRVRVPPMRAAFSALDALRGGNVPPIFVARARYDMPFINASLDEFAKGLASAGADHEFLEHPNGFHGFDVNTDDDTSREIIRRARDFMKSRLA